MESNQHVLQAAIEAFQKGELSQAQKLYQQFLSKIPEHPQALAYYGICLFQLGETDKALQHLDDAIRLSPKDPELLYNKAVLLQEDEQIEAAIELYEHLLETFPNYTLAYNNLGLCYKYLDQLDRAKIWFEKAIEANHENAAALNNLGTYYRVKDDNRMAQHYFQKALSVNPHYTQSLHNLALIKQNQKDKLAALRYFEQAYAIDPTDPSTLCTIGRIKEELCDWRDRQASEDKLKALVTDQINAGKSVTMAPFQALARGYDNATLLQISKSWAAQFDKINKQPLPLHFETTPHKLRIGYSSSDICEHATMHLMHRLFGYHDREKFEIYVYDYSLNDDSDERRYVMQHCDYFISIKELDDKAAATRIAADGIHILIDLKGYTKDHRLEILPYRPAPVIASYLGFPGMLGATYIDYLIVDHTIITPEIAKHYPEKLVYMPNSYQINDDQQHISNKPYTREMFNLPETGIVFCTMNSPYKITPEVFDIWLRLLKAVPGSVLWCYRDSVIVEHNLSQYAESQGVSNKRLVFADPFEKSEHLARLKLADMFLDSFIVNAHTTASDALWAGLPVITKIGDTFASRVSASLLKAVGLPELITTSEEAYYELALTLAQHPERLAALKAKLAENKKTYPLFNTALFTRQLEWAYQKMWDNFKSGGPVDVEVPDMVE